MKIMMCQYCRNEYDKDKLGVRLSCFTCGGNLLEKEVASPYINSEKYFGISGSSYRSVRYPGIGTKNFMAEVINMSVGL